MKHLCKQLLAKLQSRFSNEYQIYTDGSLKNGKGAWAFVIVHRGQVQAEASGQARKTTSNRMEFQAAIEALKTLKPASRATVYSDSRILVDTLTLWSPDWKANDWKKKKDRPIPSLDQVQELDRLNQIHLLKWKWIKAHSGIKYNERCDELCQQARSLK